MKGVYELFGLIYRYGGFDAYFRSVTEGYNCFLVVDIACFIIAFRSVTEGYNMKHFLKEVFRIIAFRSVTEGYNILRQRDVQLQL